MRQVEKDTGRRLVWAAVNHHDTDNPHVHIVVRGVDREGDDLRFDRRYLSHGMRWRAREILTRELGRRSGLNTSLEWEGEVRREAFTEIDRAIAEYSSPDGVVALAKLVTAPEGERRACLDRLQTLEEMQLAVRESGAWRLAEGWKGFLVRRGEDLGARGRLRALVGEDEASRYQVLRQDNPVPVSDGVVVAMGLHDEQNGEMFAAIKTKTGGRYYLRLPAPLAEKLQERDVVRVGFEAEPWLKPADRIVARFAQENGGVYDPVRRQRELEALPRTPRAGGQPTPAERVAANIRRLERLVRYRLVARLPDGRWQIPPNLLSELDDRERTHPQHRFRLDKAGRPPRAPAQPRSPDVGTEQDAIARVLSKELGLVYVAEPSAFRGRATVCAPTSSGRQYVRIVDHRTGQFTLLAKSAGMERLEGRTVQLTRDPERGLSLQIDRGISR